MQVISRPVHTGGYHTGDNNLAWEMVRFVGIICLAMYFTGLDKSF